MLRKILLTVAFPAALAVPHGALAQSGAFLAANQAAAAHDFDDAADYFWRAAQQEKNNVYVLTQALENRVKAGQMEDAIRLANTLHKGGVASPLVALTRFADAAGQGDWAGLQAILDAGPVAPGPIDAFLKAWVLAGAGTGVGQDAEAIAAFDAAQAQTEMAAFGAQQKGLALVFLGQGDQALDLFNSQPPQTDVIAALTHAQLLAQTGDGDRALAALGQFADHPFAADFVAGLPSGAGGVTPLPSAQAGLAHVFLSVGQAIQSDETIHTALLYGQLAAHLNPGDSRTHMFTGRLLDRLQSYDLAIAAYDAVPDGDPLGLMAALQQNWARWHDGQTDAALTAVRALAKAHRKDLRPHQQLGDFLRREEDFRGAEKAYKAAVRLLDAPTSANWRLFFSRGIALERQGKWRKAERDFRQALDLSPDQYQVLNYLGYTLVERQENLDEALAMIETAATAQPDAGYIIDSLGWVYFRLGRYADAVDTMERAVTLEALDPVVNDHLGDAYWAVGRKAEARFQWERTLTLITEDTDLRDIDPDRIKAKIAKGLDAVLADEGADPLLDRTGD